MMQNTTTVKNCLLTASVMLLLAACERPPVESEQIGYRGTAIVDIQNPRLERDADVMPASLPAAPAGGPRAGEVYENVQILGDLSVAEFTRFMTAITSWVSPEEGCNYCHIPTNLASDDIYTKVVSRRMIEMTQHVNGNWSDHVGETGVNCYTCHRGNPVPEEIWFSAAGQGSMTAYAGNLMGQNAPSAAVGYSSLPNDPFTDDLSGGGDGIRVIPTSAFPGDTAGATIQDTEATYGLMMHFSQSLGVSCVYCHNSASFQAWSGSTPFRTTAFHGIGMVQSLNEGYLSPLQSAYPDERLGATGDAPKAYCLTCHQGQPKPLGGASAVAGYPELTAD